MERQEPLFKFRGENKKVISQKLKKMLGDLVVPREVKDSKLEQECEKKGSS